jgi:hypothetical protein
MNRQRPELTREQVMAMLVKPLTAASALLAAIDDSDIVVALQGHCCFHSRDIFEIQQPTLSNTFEQIP